MEIDHQSLAKELEDKFESRFTDKDEDYVKSLKLKDVSPPLIYPYSHQTNNGNRRGNFNQQRYHNQGQGDYNQRDYNQRDYNQRDYNQRDQYRSNEDHSSFKRSRNY